MIPLQLPICRSSRGSFSSRLDFAGGGGRRAEDRGALIAVPRGLGGWEELHSGRLWSLVGCVMRELWPLGLGGPIGPEGQIRRGVWISQADVLLFLISESF